MKPGDDLAGLFVALGTQRALAAKSFFQGVKKRRCKGARLANCSGVERHTPTRRT